jgi:hypothetical protein
MRKPDEVPYPDVESVTYKPCKFCSSMDYDLADGDVDENGVFEPRTCDVCCWGRPEMSNSITFH